MKKIPLRKCVATQEQLPKKELIRVVKNNEGQVFVDLTGKQNTMQISKNTIDNIKKRLNSYNGNENDPGIKRAKNIINKGRISNDDGYRILDDFDNSKAGEVLDPMLQKEIRRKLDTAENISRNSREAKMSRGENVLKSAPKTGAKGGAHTPKGNNVIGITYQ